jgi:hypothetical protein
VGWDPRVCTGAWRLRSPLWRNSLSKGAVQDPHCEPVGLCCGVPGCWRSGRSCRAQRTRVGVLVCQRGLVHRADPGAVPDVRQHLVACRCSTQLCVGVQRLGSLACWSQSAGGGCSVLSIRPLKGATQGLECWSEVRPDEAALACS